jgi:hypothetical protein
MSPLVAAAVAVLTLDAQALLEPIDLHPKGAELTAADAVAAGEAQPALDLVRLAGQAVGLALGDDPALDRTLDPALGAAKVAKQLVDRLARRPATVPRGGVAAGGVVAAMVGRGRSDADDGRELLS